MKKYTVFYAEYISSVGSQTHAIINYMYIECKPSDLKEVIESEVGWGAVYYIFEGHCKQTED